MDKTSNKRIEEISILTAIFCCAVIFIHLTANPVTGLNKTSFIFKLFFVFNKSLTFVVPGFIFLSGIKLSFSYKDKQLNFLDFLKKRFVKIFIPYLVWYIIYYIYFRNAGYMESKTVYQHIFSFLLGDLVSPFYFITVIFQLYFLFGIIQWFFKKFNNFYLLLFVVLLNFLFLKFVFFKYDDRFFGTYFLYFILGFYAGLNYKNFYNFLKNYSLIISLLYILITVYNIYLSYNAYVYNAPFENYRVINGLFSLISILFLYRISIAIYSCLNKKIFFVFNKIEQASYYIFLSHCFVIYICSDFWFRLGQTSIVGKFVFSSIILFPIVFLLSIGYVSFKNKFKYVYK